MAKSLRFEVADKVSTGAVIVFDDAQVRVHASRLEPGKPVLVQIEGTTPTEDQLEQCRQLCPS
jgi:hypothetical protein